MAEKEIKLMKGNEVIAHAAIRYGCDAYFGYPITPQSEVMETLMELKPWETTGMVVLQAESEISSINMVYGGAATGKRVMTSSSSPGISLMAEGLSYIAGAELPCLIVNCQRGGPGLGTIQPSQGDYFQACKGGGHGDYRLIVLAPASVQEMHDFVALGFDLAFKYRNPAMILADGAIGQMMEKVVLAPQRPRKTNEEIAAECRDWATYGKPADRPRNVVTSLELQSEAMEKINLRLQDKYKAMEENEVRYEALACDDADYVIVISEVSTNFSNWLTTQPTAITEYAKAQGKKSIVMSISKPYDVANYADSDAIVAVYGNKGMDPTEALKPDNAFGPNIIAGVEVIFGRFAASGKLPVNVPVIENGQMTSDIKYAFGYGLTYDAVEPSSYYAVENSLLNFYNTWKDADLSVYTADSAAALKSALTAAKAVLDKSNASITEMDSAVSALVDAVNNLAYGVQKTHLNVAIVAADKLLERAADYENTEDLTAALTAAKAVYANTSATQTEVDRAASTLLDALAAMAERADLAALKKLVASAGGLEEKDFTSDSYKDLKDAMDAAKDVIDDLNRTPEAIGKAYADIITAITNLERVGNKAALVAVIAKAEAIVAAKDSYVSSTLNGLEEALAAGKAVNDNPNALQDAINNAVTLLTEKVANVRLLGDVNNDGSVTTADSALLLRSAAELDTLDDAATVSADMNQDGIADTSDAVLILQTAAEF